MHVSEWSPKSIAQLVGWALIIFSIVLVFGGVIGQGGGASHEPGSDSIRALIFEESVGQVSLAVAGLGLLSLLASIFMRKSEA